MRNLLGTEPERAQLHKRRQQSILLLLVKRHLAREGMQETEI